jgi:hypothetical protein
LFATVATLQLSPVTGLPKTTLIAVQPALAETVTSAGQVIVGGVVSLTTVAAVVPAVEVHPFTVAVTL